MNRRFSVLLPTRDRPHWLPRAIASVQDQTFYNWELIILDNPVNTPVDYLIPQDVRVYYHREPASGMGDALNRALAHATGELIVTLADDDRLPPTALETYDRMIGNHDWVVATTIIENIEGREMHRRGGCEEFVQRTRDGDYMLGGACCWRKTMHDTCGVWDPAFELCLDVDLFARFLRHADPLVIPNVCHLYTDHPWTLSKLNGGAQAHLAHQVKHG